MRGQFTETVRELQVDATATQVDRGYYMRRGYLISVDHTNWTAAVYVGEDKYTDIDIGQSLRSCEDLLVKDAEVLVLVPAIGIGTRGILTDVVGGRPRLDPFDDALYGHDHSGLGGRGKPIDYNNLVNKP